MPYVGRFGTRWTSSPLNFMKKNKPRKQLELTVSKMPGETEQQYAAWLLYCDTGSFNRLLKAWEGLLQNFSNTSPEIEGLRNRLNQPVSRRTIETWAKKYRWVERTDLRLEEELAELKHRTDKFRQKRKFLITDLLISKLTKLQKQARNEDATVLDIKYLWEMHRTEFGESTGKTEVTHRIDESEQVPPTDEEKEIGKEIDEVIKKHYDKQNKQR